MEKQSSKPAELLGFAAIAQGVCIIILVAAIFITKSFFPSVYNGFLGWYKENLLQDTSVELVLKEESQSFGESDEI